MKRVKIAEIRQSPYDLDWGRDESGIITSADPGSEDFRVSAEYVLRYQPKVGGYYIQNDDGSESFEE